MMCLVLFVAYVDGDRSARFRTVFVDVVVLLGRGIGWRILFLNVVR